MRNLLVVSALAVLAATGMAGAQTIGAPAPVATTAPAVTVPGVTVVATPLSVEERRLIRQALEGAADHGLRLSAPAVDAPDAVMIAAIETYARWQHGGRIAPRATDRQWGLVPEPFDAEGGFQAAREAGALAAWIAALPPQSAAYAGLLQERRRYAAIRAAGGWRTLEIEETLMLGARGPVVEALRQRLEMEGFVSIPGVSADRFDEGLAGVVAAFQSRRALDSDGKVGPETLRALNVPVEDRLDQIDLNLERERWAPRAVSGDRVEVDIASQSLVLFRQDRPALRMRTIVGRSVTRTPMFSSQIERVILNPPWVVPAGIAAAELWPMERRRPGYLAQRGFREINGQLVQDPGPESALGVVKFDFDSPYGVYLHDTPTRGLFGRPVRLFSHGCVRLERPRELAAELLAAQGWTPEGLNAVFGRGATRAVRLERPVPLLVVYRSAAIGEDGLVRFLPDPYGWDAKLARALARS